MSEINSQALREAAEKAGEDKWQAKKINGDFFVIRHGSYTRQHGYTSYQPIAEIDCKPVRDFVAKANPATVLELLDELEAAKKRIAELEAEPVSQAYNLPELIEGMEVSIDVSTCDADLGNRYFGTVTEALELDTAKNGYILLVQDAEPNFDINGNSPVTPDGWVIVPKKLTAENGAKGVLSGEFSETTFISCPECFGDDDCETCDGSGRIEIKVPVSWTTIKTIWAKGCEYFSIVAPQQDG